MDPSGSRCDSSRIEVSHLSNTSNVDVADAYKLPFASVSLASANAALRPNESTLPSARKSPVFKKVVHSTRWLKISLAFSGAGKAIDQKGADLFGLWPSLNNRS